MPTTTPTCDSFAGTGWTNAAGAQASDNTYATVSIGGAATSNALNGYLVNGGLGANIPADATVDEVLGLIEAKADTGTFVSFASVQALSSGVPVAGSVSAGEVLTTSDVQYEFDLTAKLDTPAKLNTVTGLLCTFTNGDESGHTVSVDYMALRIAYTEAGGARVVSTHIAIGIMV